jgi:hypothetical protein
VDLLRIASKIANAVDWVVPSLDEEYGELERIVDEGYISSIENAVDAFNHGKLKKLGLNDPRWVNIENADSGQDLTLDDVREIAGGYGRDVDRILAGIRDGSKLPAPIMLELSDGSLHNVAGNTRLMVCRALGIEPTVWWITESHTARTASINEYDIRYDAHEFHYTRRDVSRPGAIIEAVEPTTDVNATVEVNVGDRFLVNRFRADYAIELIPINGSQPIWADPANFKRVGTWIGMPD